MSITPRFLRSASLLMAGIACLSFSIPASAQLRITEVMSSSGIGGTEDWFEVTNY